MPGQHTATARNAAALREQGLKRCPTCSTTRLLDDFYRNRASRDGYASACKVCDVARSIARQARDRAAENARHKAWRDANPERAQANGRKGASRRRALIRDAFVEHVDPFVVYQRDEGVCGICGNPVERDCFDVDHVEPLSLGGEHGYANARVAHPSCNRSRGRALALAA